MGRCRPRCVCVISVPVCLLVCICTCVIHRVFVCMCGILGYTYGSGNTWRQLPLVVTGLPLFLPHLLQVSIDANGVLKVTHLVPLAAQRGRAAPLASSWAATPAMSTAFGTSNTQTGGASSQGVAVVQFVSLPVEEDD